MHKPRQNLFWPLTLSPSESIAVWGNTSNLKSSWGYLLEGPQGLSPDSYSMRLLCVYGSCMHRTAQMWRMFTGMHTAWTTIINISRPLQTAHFWDFCVTCKRTLWGISYQIICLSVSYHLLYFTLWSLQNLSSQILRKKNLAFSSEELTSLKNCVLDLLYFFHLFEIWALPWEFCWRQGNGKG